MKLNKSLCHACHAPLAKRLKKKGRQKTIFGLWMYLVVLALFTVKGRPSFWLNALFSAPAHLPCVLRGCRRSPVPSALTTTEWQQASDDGLPVQRQSLRQPQRHKTDSRMGAALYSCLLMYATTCAILASFMTRRYNCRHSGPTAEFLFRAHWPRTLLSWNNKRISASLFSA